MSDDRFFDKLRQDARPLRFDADGAMHTRIAARIRGRIAQPTIAQFLASWFRPVAVSLSALALAATLGIAWWSDTRSTETTSLDQTVEIQMAGGSYSVGD